MKYSKIICMTCDVEIKQKTELNQLEKILQIFDSYHLRGTFFFLLSSKNYQIFEETDVLYNFDKQETGLHIHWGQSDDTKRNINKNLGLLPMDLLKEDLEISLNYCKKLGLRPKSFRGGGLSQTTPAIHLISKYGFNVDSSVAAKLNECWFQNHTRVPYKSWYFPSEKGYDIPARSKEERIGILEIPVTRLIPSFRDWYPYTLTPTNPFSKAIITQWLFKSHWENPLIITPIFHSWGRIGWDFSEFVKKLRTMIEYLKKKKLNTLTMSEVYDLLVENS